MLDRSADATNVLSIEQDRACTILEDSGTHRAERRLHAREQRSSLESPATDGFASDRLYAWCKAKDNRD